MKLLQKTYSLVGILLLCGGILLGAEKRRSSQRVLTKKEVLESIVEASEKVFSHDGFLLAEENKKTLKWYEMLSKVRSYVNENAGGDDLLLDAFSLCWVVGRELINVLKNTYNSLFSEGGSMSYDNVKTASNDIEELWLEQEFSLQKMYERLNSEVYFGKRKDVRDVLMSLIIYVSAPIIRLRNEFHDNEEIYEIERVDREKSQQVIDSMMRLTRIVK